MSAGLIISIISLCIAIASVSIGFYFSKLSAKTSVRPILVFLYSPDRGWNLSNIGNGPALNLLLTKAPYKRWEMPTRCYPLAAKDSINIWWMGHNMKKLGVSYDDVHGRTYTSICEEDQNVIHYTNCLEGFSDAEIKKVWEYQDMK